MLKPANTSLNLLHEIKNRWSPRAFSSQLVEPEKLERIFEAARWSASCSNEQPWRFLVGIKNQDQAWTKILNSLNIGNQIWCKFAPVLVLLISKSNFTRNDRPNKWSNYDLGQSAAYLSVQATSEGLFVHQMAGFNAEKARSLLSIPDDFEVKTAMAIGYYGDAENLPEDKKTSEFADRSRKELKAMVYSGEWNRTADFIK